MKVRFGVPFQSKPSFGGLSILWLGGAEMFDAFWSFCFSFLLLSIGQGTNLPGYVAVIINPQISEA